MAISKENSQPPVFKHFSSNEIEVIRESATVKTLKPGDVLIRAGEDSDRIYVILKGKIRIIKGQKDQAESLTTLGMGEWVGEVFSQGK